CADRGRLGLFSVAGDQRPAGRNQFPVATVWNFKPVVGDSSFLRGYYHTRQNEEGPLRVGDGGPTRMADCGDLQRVLPENLQRESAHWIPGTRAATDHRVRRNACAS